MKDIKSKFDEFKSIPFPEGLAGEEIGGIDLVMLDADTAGLITTFVSSRGKLTASNFQLLKRLRNGLRIVTKGLDGISRSYFSVLWNLSERTIDFIQRTNNLIDINENEALHNKWKNDFHQIRLILNEWDPIGVSDSVDDEYDSLNFKAYSCLLYTSPSPRDQRGSRMPSSA